MSDPALEALWKHVLDNWDDDAAHGLFLEHCQRVERLGDAAVRYRGMTGDRERGKSAEKRLSGVALLAMAALESSRRGAPESSAPRGAIALIALFSVGIAGLLAYLFSSR